MKSALARSVLAGSVVAAWLAGCNPSSIGRACVNPNGDKPSGTQISSPALECASRLCLIQANTTLTPSANESCPGGRCTCTAECGSDGDCAAETKEFCTAGFACAVAAEAGPFCCRKLCICRDDLVDGFNVMVSGDTQKVITPFACDPKASGSIVTCKNVK